MKTKKTLILGTLASASTLLLLSAAPANAEVSIAPDVCTTIYLENGQECASVSINGKEVVTYRGEGSSKSAEEKAEELTAKVQDLLDSGKYSFDQLLPACEGSIATIRSGEKTVLKFDPPRTADKPSPIGQSLKLVNAIRKAAGKAVLPVSFCDIAEAVSKGKNAILKAAGKHHFSGKASWYGKKFHGRRAANGERYDMHKLTAAHRTLPFGTKLLVMNRKTGNTCVVKVNDRGPYHGNRVIDLSKGAAKKLNMISSGVAMVDVIVLGN